MKNQILIEGLFHKASNQPVVSSFSETKGLFLASVAASSGTVVTKKPSVFTTKNVLIMITIISTIAVTFMLSTNDKNVLPEPEAKTPFTVTEKEPKEERRNEVIEKKQVINEVPVKDAITPLKPKAAPKVDFLKSEVFIEEFKEEADPKTRVIIEEPEDNTEYIFPVLTEDQIKANEKRKKKMIKVLSKFDKKDYAYIPSGSYKYEGELVSIQAFYMSTKEITNGEYKTFLFDLLINNRKEEFKKAKPNQGLWTQILGASMEPMKNLYFSDEQFEDYPVVNISREGAEMYCKWLSTEVRPRVERKNIPDLNDLRLPLRVEWNYAAYGDTSTMDYPWGTNSITNESGCFLANLNLDEFKTDLDEVECVKNTDSTAMTTAGAIADGALYTAKVGSYNPNWFGLFNMCGNVAEMVYESYGMEDGNFVRNGPGTAGGGWMSSEEELKKGGTDKHAGEVNGNLNIGFRVVITHIAQKK